MFLIVDTEGMDLQTVGNGDLHHVHGACNPVMALGGQKVDALVVGGIGGGALVRLNAMGVKVYEAGAPKVKENLKLFKDNKLEELSLDHSCKAHEGGCGH
jgi:predicted Fe-Mo cluster-binding NifX family protein